MTGAKLCFFRAAMTTNKVNARTAFVHPLCRAACVDPLVFGSLSCGTLLLAPDQPVAEAPRRQKKNNCAYASQMLTFQSQA